MTYSSIYALVQKWLLLNEILPQKAPEAAAPPPEPEPVVESIVENPSAEESNVDSLFGEDDGSDFLGGADAAPPAPEHVTPPAPVEASPVASQMTKPSVSPSISSLFGCRGSFRGDSSFF